MLTVLICLVQISEFLVYDDGYHLRKFANNPVRNILTKIAQDITAMEIVVDKLHFKGHIDCRRNCTLTSLHGIMHMYIVYHVHVIIIYYSYFSRLLQKSGPFLGCHDMLTKHMNTPHFMFYLLYVCDLHTKKRYN